MWCNFARGGELEGKVFTHVFGDIFDFFGELGSVFELILDGVIEKERFKMNFHVHKKVKSTLFHSWYIFRQG